MYSVKPSLALDTFCGLASFITDGQDISVMEAADKNVGVVLVRYDPALVNHFSANGIAKNLIEMQQNFAELLGVKEVRIIVVPNSLNIDLMRLRQVSSRVEMEDTTDKLRLHQAMKGQENEIQGKS